MEEDDEEDDLSRMERIAILFPQEKEEERQFFMLLLGLLVGLPDAGVNEGALFFMPSNPEDAQPFTQLQLADVPYPAVLFDTSWLIFLEAGRFTLSSLPPQILPAVVRPEATETAAWETANARNSTWYKLSEIILRLHGRLRRIDHTGVVIPSSMATRSEWDTMIGRVGLASNLYRYPTGEDWPFILPATDAEFASDITTFDVGRGPKFEFVYANGLDMPVFQIDLETDMERQEVEDLFPAPFGFSLPGLEDYFRSVYVQNPWPGLLIRFDLRFRPEGAPSDWDTGEWLVKQGERIRATDT